MPKPKRDEQRSGGGMIQYVPTPEQKAYHDRVEKKRKKEADDKAAAVKRSKSEGHLREVADDNRVGMVKALAGMKFSKAKEHGEVAATAKRRADDLAEKAWRASRKKKEKSK